MKGLDEVVRLKRLHRRWVLFQGIFGALPVFALANRIQPMVADGYGRDALPDLLPEFLGRHYNLELAAALLALAASEILRRRFHKKHKDDLSL